MLDGDRLFHATLVAGTGSLRLRRLPGQLQQERPLALALAERSRNELGRTADDHRQLLDALHRSPEQARAELTAHLKPAPPSCNGCSTCSPTGPKERQLLADDSTDDAWDLIVTPRHLDEYIPAFPIPAGATQVIRPVLPSGPVRARMSLLHRAAADAVMRAARPPVLSGDCPTARASVAGLQRRHRDLALLWLDAHGDCNTPDISTSAISAAWHWPC